MNSLRDPGLVVALGLAVLVCDVVASRIRGAPRVIAVTLAQALLLPIIVRWARLRRDSAVAREEHLAQTAS